MSVWVVVVVVVVALAAAQLLLRELRRPLPAVPAVPAAESAGSVSVVVPARDEERSLPALVASLRRLTVGVREVVVVDDASHDATAAVARAAGATVVSAGPLPAGWTGKAWACHVGAAATSGDLLLFLDADTVLAPDALAGLLGLHQEHGGLVSVQPFHTAARGYEQLSSYFNLVPLLASGAFGPRPARRPMAFGPCLLTTRGDYERAGGHATVRGAILDDVELAAAYRRAGLPVHCAVGAPLVTMRSYPGGIRQLAAGWTKNVASGASAAAPGPTAAAVAWVSAHHAVAVGATTAVAAALLGRGTPVVDLALWAAAWLAVAAQLRWLLRRVGSFRWWTWALFPAPLLAFDVLFAASIALTAGRRSVRWRGRPVGVGRRSSGEVS